MPPILISLLLLSIGFLSQPSEARTSQYDLTGTFLQAMDGDTFDLLVNGDVCRIRLKLVGTPERGRWHHKEAKAALEKLLKGRDITAECYKKHMSWGRVRHVCRVFANEIDVDMTLFRMGFGAYMKKFEKQFTQDERALFVQHTVL